MTSNLELIVRARDRDIGGFSVRRLLPYATHRMVGPFIFFDLVGPAVFPPGAGMDVRPHPHMNLATVTYLFEGQIHHRDSLGSDQVISPGDINWMMAGRGIVHSERTPQATREAGYNLHAIQCWVAYPEKFEEIEPQFYHHPKATLPEFKLGEAKIKLLLGTLFDQKSPVLVHTDIFYAEVHLPKGAQLRIPLGTREGAVNVVKGSVRVNDEPLETTAMGIAKKGDDLRIVATEDSHIMLLGGDAIGPRFIFWNLVSSTEERIEEAKLDWARGPGASGSRFPLIPGDSSEFIPLPEEPKKNPKGTSF